MSIIFYDKLVVIKSLDKKIEKLTESGDEKQEMWQMVEEIIHHKVLGCCLDHLPKEHHSEFLDMFHKAPHDENLLKYLSKKSKTDMKKVIKQEIKDLTKDLLLLDSNKV
ncbi:MAG TPA: hypothetical protein VI795_01045 [Patescibacteria group bacterium]|nr:hypothetical protein [Patescibacteria group bacterium]